MRSSLGEAGALEVVYQGDHRAGVDTDRSADLLLDRQSLRQEVVEHREEGGRETDRFERGRGLGVRRTPEAEEELPRELGDGRIGWVRRHPGMLAHLLRYLNSI